MPVSNLKQPLRDLLFLLTLILLVLGAAEAGVRMADAAGILPSPEALLWHRPEVNGKLRQIQELKEQGSIEAVFAGSSLVYTGVNPAVFDQEYQALSGQPIRSYNIGLAAISLELNERFFERVFYPELKPKVVFWVISPRDMNQNSPIPQEVDKEVMASPYGQARLGYGLQAWLTQGLLDHSVLYRFRRVLMVSLLNGLRFPSSLPTTFDNPDFDALGFVHYQANLGMRVAAGQNPDPGQFGYQSLLNFQPEGQNAQGLARLAQFCRQQGIDLILVNAPLTRYMADGFSDPQADYQHYLEVVSGLTAEYQLSMWDFNQTGLREEFSDQDFGDLAHLNESGAAKLSTQLAQMYLYHLQDRARQP